MSNIMNTTYEDDENCTEWDIRVSFDVFPGQTQTLEDPGLAPEIEVTLIERYENTIDQDTWAWVPFVSESDEQLDKWEQECWESMDGTDTPEW